MDIGNITVKEILEKKFGHEKAKRILDMINASYKKGKRGQEMETAFKTVLENEGAAPVDITISIAQVIPTY